MPPTSVSAVTESKDKQIVYSCVARGATILCSYQTSPSDYSFEAEANVVLDLLIPNQRLKRTGRHVFPAAHYRFYCIIRKGMVYMCASEPEDEKRKNYLFLSHVKKNFIMLGLMEDVSTAKMHSMDPKFRNELSQLTLKYYNIGPSLEILQSDLHEVRMSIGKNYDTLMERGENLDYLTHKAKTLEAAAETFKVTGNQLQGGRCCRLQGCRICAIVVGVLVGLIVLMVTLWFSGALGEVPIFLEDPPFPPPPVFVNGIPAQSPLPAGDGENPLAFLTDTS